MTQVELLGHCDGDLRGCHGRDGTITITFNSQFCCLPAPSDNGKEMKYLPCEGCGKLQTVELNVVSVHCNACFNPDYIGDRGEILGYSHACGYHD